MKKEKKTSNINIRVTDSLLYAIRDLAIKHKCSMSNLVEAAFISYVEADEKTKDNVSKAVSDVDSISRELYTAKTQFDKMMSSIESARVEMIATGIIRA